MYACGGLLYGNHTLQWAKTTKAADAAVARLRGFGVPVDLRAAPGLPGSGRVTRALLADANPDSLLDVGGFGEYRDAARRTRCVNIHPHVGCDAYAAGAPLPYRSRRFHTVLLETVLNHAAEDALALLAESARVARRRVIVAEDVLDRRASRSVVDAYRAHDPWAVYRSTDEWLALGRRNGLALQRIVALDRVPLHVAREAWPACTLDYPPVQYFVFCVTSCVKGAKLSEAPRLRDARVGSGSLLEKDADFVQHPLRRVVRPVQVVQHASAEFLGYSPPRFAATPRN